MNGFADRFSDTQRAALAALGYTLLERRDGHAPANRPAGTAAVGGDRGQVSAPARRPSPATPAPTVPVEVCVEGMDGSALARGILAAADTVAGADRVHLAGDTLRIAVDGNAPPWTVSLEQLRRSPKHKAALWRALRTLRRSSP